MRYAVIEERRAAAFHVDVWRCTELRFSASQRVHKRYILSHPRLHLPVTTNVRLCYFNARENPAYSSRDLYDKVTRSGMESVAVGIGTEAWN